MPFSATKFIEKQITNTRGLCKSCKFYKTAKIVNEVEICTLSDKFLIPEYEPNYTCRNFERSDTNENSWWDDGRIRI